MPGRKELSCGRPELLPVLLRWFTFDPGREPVARKDSLLRPMFFFLQNSRENARFVPSADGETDSADECTAVDVLSSGRGRTQVHLRVRHFCQMSIVSSASSSCQIAFLSLSACCTLRKLFSDSRESEQRGVGLSSAWTLPPFLCLFRSPSLSSTALCPSFCVLSAFANCGQQQAWHRISLG